MRNGIDAYVQSVMEFIVADQTMKKRIERDLLSHINEVCGEVSEWEIIEKMGPPEEMAREFMDNIYEDKEEVLDRLVYEKAINRQLMNGFYEYKSTTELFGLPLVHVKVGRGYRRRLAVAKGIIAIGDVAIGIFAMGGIAIGGICLGGFALGLLSFAGIALGLLLAAGGISVGALAIGGIAIGLGAIGGLAIGKIAFGGLAKGVAAIGGKAIGQYVISGVRDSYGSYHLENVSKEQIETVIRQAYPGIAQWIVRIFTVFGS